MIREESDDMDEDDQGDIPGEEQIIDNHGIIQGNPGSSPDLIDEIDFEEGGVHVIDNPLKEDSTNYESPEI